MKKTTSWAALVLTVAAGCRGPWADADSDWSAAGRAAEIARLAETTRPAERPVASTEVPANGPPSNAVARRSVDRAAFAASTDASPVVRPAAYVDPAERPEPKASSPPRPSNESPPAARPEPAGAAEPARAANDDAPPPPQADDGSERPAPAPGPGPTERPAGKPAPAAGSSAPEPLPPPKKSSAAKRESRRPVLELDPDAGPGPFTPLSMREVSESVYVAFPALEALRQEAAIADGRQLAAWGEFDFKIKADNFAAPLGYYDNYRTQLKLEQGLFNSGANVYGQYRLGDGNIQPWYGERETNEGGEFKAGMILPLLRDRAIDQRRADVFQATLRRQQVDPMVQAALLDFNLTAAEAYWSWVAAGLNYDVQKRLLRVTVDRNRVYEERVAQQDLARLELVQNRRLIASREAKVVEAERKLQQSALKLSLFLRDEAGRPVAPSPALLPDKMPVAEAVVEPDIDGAVDVAFDLRPELFELDLMRDQAEIDLENGRNQRLPAVNATLDASKDVGAPASKKGDKTPFELEAGLLVDVPLQRRKADGKIREAEGKLAQIAAKRRFTENKIEVQVRDAMSALATAYERAQRAHENLVLAEELEKAERERFDEGESDLLRVALQEGAAIEAAVAEIEAQSDYFKARAALEAAMGVDPVAGGAGP